MSYIEQYGADGRENLCYSAPKSAQAGLAARNIMVERYLRRATVILFSGVELIPEATDGKTLTTISNSRRVTCSRKELHR